MINYIVSYYNIFYLRSTRYDMKEKNQAHKIVLSFLLALTAVFCINHHEAVAHAAGSDRIYYFNMDDKGLEGSMILVQTDGHWGLMDAGHTKATTVTDASGRTYSTTVHGLSSQVYCRNGADVANYMINNLGVTHLDFVVGTHAHSDHVGGIPGVAAATYRDASGNLRYLVDSNTTYYYKEYQHISDVEDDLVRYSSDSWHNQAFAYQAAQSMENRGANLVDVSKAQVIQGDPGNAYGDYVTFEVGNMSFRLYNVHEQTNTGSENVNSIVTVMTNGEYSVVNLSDINTNNGAIDRTSAAIAKDFGAVDVVVAGHHGYTGSNTKAMFDALKPSFVIVPNGMESSWLYTDGDLAAAIPYAQGLFGTAFYNLSISPYAVVTDLNGQQVYVYSVSGSGDLNNAINKMMKASNKTGWASWIQTNGTLWSYLEDGKSVKNAWKKLDGEWYHFDSTGIMQTGFITAGGDRYYMNSSGAMTTGWQKVNGYWYYLNPDRNSDVKFGAMMTGWQKIKGDWYYMFDDGKMARNQWVGNYYLTSNGAMLTGWQKISGYWYLLDSNGKKLTGWQKDDGDWFYMYSDGKMARNEWVGNCYVKSNGAMVTGWQKVGGYWYYLNPTRGNGTEYGGKMTGWQKIDGDWYYMYSDGKMARNTWVEDCYLKDNGAMVTGWQKVGGYWYYLNPSRGNGTKYGGKMTGWQKVDGDWYYMYSDGKMARNEWVGNCYVKDNGAMVTGWQIVGGNWYYLNPDHGNGTEYGGKMTGWQKINGKDYYFYSDGKMAADTWIDNYYVDSSGAWVKGEQKPAETTKPAEPAKLAQSAEPVKTEEVIAKAATAATAKSVNAAETTDLEETGNVQEDLIEEENSQSGGANEGTENVKDNVVVENSSTELVSDDKADVVDNSGKEEDTEPDAGTEPEETEEIGNETDDDGGVEQNSEIINTNDLLEPNELEVVDNDA